MAAPPCMLSSRWLELAKNVTAVIGAPARVAAAGAAWRELDLERAVHSNGQGLGCEQQTSARSRPWPTRESSTKSRAACTVRSALFESTHVLHVFAYARANSFECLVRVEELLGPTASSGVLLLMAGELAAWSSCARWFKVDVGILHDSTFGDDTHHRLQRCA